MRLSLIALVALLSACGPGRPYTAADRELDRRIAAEPTVGEIVQRTLDSMRSQYRPPPPPRTMSCTGLGLGGGLTAIDCQ